MTDVTRGTYPPPVQGAQTMQIGNVWRLTFQTFRQAPWRFIAFALLPILFSFVASLITVPFRHDKNAVALAVSLSFVVTLAQLAFQLVVQSAGIYAACRLLAGGGFTMGESLAVGFRRFWASLGLIILLVIIVLLGYIALIVPGIIAALVLAVAYQACVVENRGPIESMQRSAFLTKGNRLRIFGAYLLVLVVPLVAVFVIFGIVVAITAAISGQHSQIGGVITGVLAVLIMIPLFLILGGIVNVLLAVIFVELRRVKEGGFARESVATVFD